MKRSNGTPLGGGGTETLPTHNVSSFNVSYLNTDGHGDKGGTSPVLPSNKVPRNTALIIKSREIQWFNVVLTFIF